MNKGLAGRQWFHPKESQWRQMISQKTADNVTTIKPQVEDDTAHGGYYRLLRDIAALDAEEFGPQRRGCGHDRHRCCRASTPFLPQRLNASTPAPAAKWG
jgi:hypothetical protein